MEKFVVNHMGARRHCWQISHRRSIGEGVFLIFQTFWQKNKFYLTY